MAEGGYPLGTKEYWDHVYTKELSSFRETGDIGKVWFGYQIQDQIATWLETSSYVTQSDRILDIGCGNGALLTELAERGFGNLCGVDYSERAIELAKEVARMEEVAAEFSVADVCNTDSSILKGREFDVCLDKGTYDAISMGPGDADMQRAMYIQSLSKLLKDDGLFIIASSNWTKEELIEHFNPGFVCIAALTAPKLHFGEPESGGTIVSTVVFQRRLTG